MQSTQTDENKPKVFANSGVHDQVLELLTPLPRGRILDAPAGEGALTTRLAELDFPVTACDITNGLKVQGIPFLQADLNSCLPFVDDAFDYVACVEGVEHIENPYQLIREFSRILKPGGTLVLSTPNILSIRSRLRFFFSSHHRRFKEIWPGGHLSALSYREYKYAFEKAGFTVEKIATNRFRKKWPILYPLLRAAIRMNTLRHHPLGKEVVLPEILDGAILVLKGKKN